MQEKPRDMAIRTRMEMERMMATTIMVAVHRIQRLMECCST